MIKMVHFMIEKGYIKRQGVRKGMRSMFEAFAYYKEIRRRIYSASVGRAMFVTSKGFIGLTPWNAQQGDVVSVLFGGCTPFILRKVPRRDQYSLVGEAYVYRIMGGELFTGRMMRHPRLRAFDLV